MGTIRTFATVQSALGFVLLAPIPTTPRELAQLALTDTFIFQYFPETINDSQPVDYEKVRIPGASHPLYQWISGGPRVISFRATFTSERIVPIPATDITNKYNVDINGALAVLRSFRHPTYDDTSVVRARPPQRLGLTIPGTFLSAYPFVPVTCVLTDLKVDYKAWHSAGVPRRADVDLTFEEVVQNPFRGINYVDRNDYLPAKLLYSSPASVVRRAFS